MITTSRPSDIVMTTRTLRLTVTADTAFGRNLITEIEMTVRRALEQADQQDIDAPAVSLSITDNTVATFDNTEPF